jgi:hypothetical protein
MSNLSLPQGRLQENTNTKALEALTDRTPNDRAQHRVNDRTTNAIVFACDTEGR